MEDLKITFLNLRNLKTCKSDKNPKLKLLIEYNTFIIYSNQEVKIKEQEERWRNYTKSTSAIHYNLLLIKEIADQTLLY